MATSERWPCSSLHDVNMLIYSLADNPALLHEVREEVHRFVRRLSATMHPLRTALEWVEAGAAKEHGRDALRSRASGAGESRKY